MGLPLTSDADDLPQLAVSVPEAVSSQRMLITLLADFGFAQAGPVPSAAIVELLGDFDITPAGARIALSRVARTGMLEQLRNGRQTSYTVSADGLAERESRLRSYVEFASTPPDWDGQWTVVAFSIPEHNRSQRPKLRRELERLRFAALTDAVWVQPHDHAEQVIAVGRELSADIAVMRSSFVDRATGLDPVAAFPLDHVRTLYDHFRETFEPWLPYVLGNVVDERHALVLRANVLASWRNIALSDPDLPTELLPSDWPRDATRELFVTLWEQLGPIALRRVRSIVSPFDAELASRLSVRRV